MMPRGSKQSVFLNADDLRRLYIDERLPSGVIAVRFGCSKPTVLKALRSAGIVLRHHNDTKRGKPARNRVSVDEAAILAAYQASANTSKMDVVRSLGATYAVVCRVLREHGIKRNSLSDIVRGTRFGRMNPNWKDHISAEERARRRDMAKQAMWRAKVYERDGYACQCCGDAKGGNLNAHHIEDHCSNKFRRWAIDNGTTLCEGCHRAFHKRYGYTGNDMRQLSEFFIVRGMRMAA